LSVIITYYIDTALMKCRKCAQPSVGCTSREYHFCCCVN